MAPLMSESELQEIEKNERARYACNPDDYEKSAVARLIAEVGGRAKNMRKL